MNIDNVLIFFKRNSKIILILTSIGIAIFSFIYLRPPKTLKDLAYDINPFNGYTVYIEELENEEIIYVPYLVLTANYNYSNNVLVLREDLLDEILIWNDYVGYYEDSVIDKYLNNEFKKRLSENIKNSVLNSTIEITDMKSIGRATQFTTFINRDIFLLSHRELSLAESSVVAIEGYPLKYFKDRKNTDIYIAKRKGENDGWWLRSPDTWEYVMCVGITYEGSLGGGGVYYENGIRPAFCLNQDLKVSKKDNIIDGKSVYILDFDIKNDKLGG